MEALPEPEDPLEALVIQGLHRFIDPVITEIRRELTPVEHDPFIDDIKGLGYE